MKSPVGKAVVPETLGVGLVEFCAFAFVSAFVFAFVLLLPFFGGTEVALLPAPPAPHPHFNLFQTISTFHQDKPHKCQGHTKCKCVQALPKRPPPPPPQISCLPLDSFYNH